ncbi:NADH-quinone oxidoreductase subunit J [bacterium]|nr:NADH-quinone oxidoreductase subunit J [bacterium]
MINNPIIFYTASFLIMVFTLITLMNKNVIYSLLASIMVFFSGAIFFYMLGSEYNAIIQAAVYGLAVPVLIGLSIMFTQKNEDSTKIEKLSFLTLIFGMIFAFIFVDTIIFSISKLPKVFNFVELSQINPYDVISSFAAGIFINYVWAFELLSLLLTIVIAGLTLFRKKGA